MKRLHLCRVRWRRLSGQQLGGVPSRFLRDLPAEVIDHVIAARPRTTTRKPKGWPLAGSLEPRRAERAGTWPGSCSAGARGPVGNHHPALRPRHGARRRGRAGLRVGGKLRHAKFGVGEVRAWQSVGDDFKVTVRFTSVGVKTVMAKFLQRL